MGVKVFAVAAAAAVAMVPTAPSAVAAPAVDLLCQTYGSHVTCFALHSGASPMTITWTRDGVHVPALDGFGTYFGRCVYGEVVTVAATVTDPTGSTTAGEAFPCNTGPWPEGPGPLRRSTVIAS